MQAAQVRFEFRETHSGGNMTPRQLEFVVSETTFRVHKGARESGALSQFSVTAVNCLRSSERECERPHFSTKRLR
jgi:hypothetical protein